MKMGIDCAEYKIDGMKNFKDPLSVSSFSIIGEKGVLRDEVNLWGSSGPRDRPLNLFQVSLMIKENEHESDRGWT